MTEQRRSFQKLLVANRGEIAARIISTARELGLITFACFTENDIGHTYNAAHAVRLSSPAAYTDIEEILKVAKENDVDAIHPAYGYLSESAAFAKRMQDIGVLVIGPGHSILEATGDKLQARLLAERCGVPVLPALPEPTSTVEAVAIFAKEQGLPIMVKAVDGGGGRGIRLIKDMEDLESLTALAIKESPSKQVFAEKAAIDGFRHVEVQIIGDGHGDVRHLWERECSIQRRYQKVVELAPSTLARPLVQPVIEAAVTMAQKINYKSLGTFEFLLHPSSGKYFFLEVNPRLQVEHTITESICGLDIVEVQLRLAQGLSLDEAGLGSIPRGPATLPTLHSVQLRITAENAERNWTLSSGTITSCRWPQGNGIRIDSALVSGKPYTVSTDFDSVIAKLVITAASWQAVVAKARRALADTEILGVQTNLSVLQAIVTSHDFLEGKCDTQWLEKHQHMLIQHARTIESSKRDPLHGLAGTMSTSIPAIRMSSSSTLFKPGDAWAVSLTTAGAEHRTHRLQLTKILKNDFPNSLRAELTWTGRHSPPQDYQLELEATAASAAAIGAQHRRGDPRDSSHVIVPFAGKLIEVNVEEGQSVKKGDCIAVVQQMKMELEVRAQVDGTVSWVCEIEDGEDVAEGVLAAIIDDGATSRPKL